MNKFDSFIYLSMPIYLTMSLRLKCFYPGCMKIFLCHLMFFINFGTRSLDHFKVLVPFDNVYTEFFNLAKLLLNIPSALILVKNIPLVDAFIKV